MTTLVIGLGNTLRKDDGAGIHVARLLTGRLGNVECSAGEHPGPELAERIASFDRVVFIDASASTETVRMIPVTGGGTAWMLHSAGVRQLLGMAQFLYGRTPSAAYLVEIPAYDFDHGEGFSHRTERAAQEAARLVEQLVHAGSEQDSFLQPCGE